MAATTSGRRRGPRRAFSEDEVLDAAQQLLDEGGPEAASVRAVAKRLGVAPNTVYTYFRDRDALHHALAERLLGRVDRGLFADTGRPWRERAEALALELRRQLTCHPGAVGLVIGAPLDGAHARGLQDHVRGLFADAGLDAADADGACGVLLAYVVGALALGAADPASGPALRPAADRDQYLSGLHRVLDGLGAGVLR